MTALTAIQTLYAGCRFRSRLEARWAVAFDSLGIGWQYEPQGYTVGPDATPYLPDFFLPDLGLWVEVKGAMEPDELRTLIWAASPAGLPVTPSTEERPLRIWPYRSRMLVLGDVPPPGTSWLHSRVDVWAEDLVMLQPVVLWPGKGGRLATLEMLAAYPLNQFLAGIEPEPGFLRMFTEGTPTPMRFDPAHRVAEAYRAARSARFEHGESGAA